MRKIVSYLLAPPVLIRLIGYSFFVFYLLTGTDPLLSFYVFFSAIALITVVNHLRISSITKSVDKEYCLLPRENFKSFLIVNILLLSAIVISLKTGVTSDAVGNKDVFLFLFAISLTIYQMFFHPLLIIIEGGKLKIMGCYSYLLPSYASLGKNNRIHLELVSYASEGRETDRRVELKLYYKLNKTSNIKTLELLSGGEETGKMVLKEFNRICSYMKKYKIKYSSAKEI